jgi:tetratricopeptide (TPR) repeat protein
MGLTVMTTWGRDRQVKWGICLVGLFLLIGGCSYHYHRGLELEAQGQFEEANIEFHRAYVQSPGNASYKTAYLRTAALTTEDLLERYDRYLRDKQYRLAYRRLEQAQGLTPDHPRIDEEMKRWFHVLLAGRIDLAEIQSLQHQIPLADRIELVIRLNTPNVIHRLEAPINYQNNTFSVEDILYDPPPNLLLMYSINAIGVKTSDNRGGGEQFRRFVDYKTPVLTDITGRLSATDSEMIAVDSLYPADLLRRSISSRFLYPTRDIRYSLELDGSQIRVSSKDGDISYLPQLMYSNRRDRRYFLDFGHLVLSQQQIGGSWAIRRVVTDERDYLKDLQRNILLNTYFFYRDGGYPFVLTDTAGNG